MEFLNDHVALVSGLIAACVAGLARLADYRRLHRADRDKVGIMPWTGVFFWATLFAAVLLTAAVEQWLAPQG